MQRSRSFARTVNRLLAGATDIRPGEGRAVLAAAGLFFLVLAVIMVLRPVREATGLKSGVENVRWLFLGTLASIVALMPVFGWLVSRVRRRGFLAVSYRTCALILLGFYLGLSLLPGGAVAVLGPVYYVFHSVFNLFLVSLFWALMADLFSVTESKRLFPPIAVGGTLGAIVGSVLARQLAERIGPTSLFLVAIGLLEAAVWMAAIAARSRRGHAPRSTEARPLGGHAWAGVTKLVQSPYLLGIGLFILLSAVTSTFLYFTELRLVAAAAESVGKRTVLFANINVWTQVATLIAQAFIAGRIMRFVGVGAGLALLPLYCAGGLVVLAAGPTLSTYIVVNALFRAVQRGVARPARETLFTVLSREDKYKAKACLDTFVSRTGDAAGAQLERVLVLPTLGAVGLAAVVLPTVLVWTGLAFGLAAAQSRLASRPGWEERGGLLPKT